MAQHNNKKRKKINRRKRQFLTPKNIIIVIIILAMATVIISLILAINTKPENLIQSKVSALATDYYENHLYQEYASTSASSSPEDLAKVMSKYEKYGLSPIALRQILLYDYQKNTDTITLVQKYCDENRTSIKFFPEPPYSQKSYHIEYTYACDF